MLSNFRASLLLSAIACIGSFGSGSADLQMTEYSSTSLLTKEQIINGFEAGITSGATHMLIVWDTWDYDNSYNFLVYSYPEEDVNDLIKQYDAPGYYRVSAVLAMHLDLDQQLNDKRWYPEYLR